MVYHSTHWSGKGCIAHIAIEPTNISVHHCFLTFPWSKPVKIIIKQRGMNDRPIKQIEDKQRVSQVDKFADKIDVIQIS